MLARVLARPAQKIAVAFTPKITVNISRKNFTVRTAETAADIKDIMRLRYEVFHREYMGKKFPIGFDFDEHDINADHLMIIDNRNQVVVGTYRMILCRSSEKFYSQAEFNLNQFLLSPGAKLELGRACIKKSYRSGILVHLLWRGISEYISRANVEHVFGCSSVKTTDVTDSARLMAALTLAGHTANGFNISPTAPYTMPGFDEEYARQLNIGQTLADVADILPSLVHAYLSMGGKIHGAPALDRDYRCIDLLTILPMDHFNERFSKKYLQ